MLDTLKREKLMFNWREKQQAKAAVLRALRFAIRPPTLPAAYTKEVRAEKMAPAVSGLQLVSADLFAHAMRQLRVPMALQSSATITGKHSRAGIEPASVRRNASE